MKIVPATSENILKAAATIKRGGLVIIPTETVYGLAADATDPKAVAKIFAAKQRPHENPLIVHIADLSQVDSIATSFPPTARILAERFWPGPLTLVLPKSRAIPDLVTGCLDTVAVRMPRHEVALAVIRESGRPIAAPSANRFMKLSPTRAEHVEPELGDQVKMILDGGPCEVGVESTVVDCTSDLPRILRPGGISRGRIEAALGAPLGALPPQTSRRSPGMYSRHYAPRTILMLVDRLEESMAGLTFERPLNENQIKMPASAVAYSAVLYDNLHRLDRMNLPAIFVQHPPDDQEWEAVRDRLLKASQPP